MTDDLAALAKLASEATPGPWIVTETAYDGSPEVGTAEDEHGVLCRGHAYDDYGTIETRDVSYIAAASPDVVLALVRVALAAKSVVYVVTDDAASAEDLAVLRAALVDLDR